MSLWAPPYDLLREEFIQRRDEGCCIPGSLSDRFDRLHPQVDAWNVAVIDPLFDALDALEPDPALAANEPNDLAAIRALRPDGPRDLGWKPDDRELLDRLHGAWTGRCVGCALGKPVEGMGMSHEHGRLAGRERIRRYLTNRGDWPLRDYFSGRDAGDGLTIGCSASQREHIAFMEPDDDVHYSLTGLGVLEERGPAFIWSDVAQYWMDHIPLSAICTAETQAICNVINRSSRCGTGGWGMRSGGTNSALTPAFTRRHRNPYREWIGAQIRSDGWAWTCAGKPELAAEFAYRDASWTHERNGIYGEMFCAAMQAAAFVERNPAKLVEIGLSEIPQRCRLALAVRTCLGWITTAKDFEACMTCLEAAYPKMSAVHTINNALICVLSLFYGRMDTVDSIAIGVMCGLDTDCNGATVGSIVGAAAGRKAFRDDLAGRLHDTVKPNMIGFQEVTMAELATRTLAQWKRVDAYHRERSPGAPQARSAAGH